MSEPDFGTSAQNSEAQNKLASNKLASNKLASNKLASNKLASNKLASNRLVALDATSEIMQTADGREVYSYLISCALDAGVTIEKSDVIDVECADPNTPDTCVETGPANDAYCVDGHCVFAGSLGLAPEWERHKLNKKGQGWVSACMFARVNNFGTATDISLRGCNSALTVSQSEAELYTVQEGAFYGNIFTKGNDPIEWIACRGEGQAAGESGGLELRDCAEEDPNNPGFTYCGFTYAGDCADYTPETPSNYACRTSHDGVYGTCHEGDGPGKWKNLKKYREVITVYVSN